MQFNNRRLLVVMMGMVGALVGTLALFIATSTPTQAQLTCENPPIDVTNLQRTWNLTDFCTYEEGVFGEIISGGVGRDGIPPIDNPTFESIADADAWLAPQSPVIAIANDDGEEARAYPLSILTRHEIVNDMWDGMPIAVTFCPLCNSAIVFDRTLDDEVLRLGVSGLLRNSDLIMWDDVTQSWWQQFTGEGIVGEYTGRQLDILPSLVISYELFTERYPEGEVLSRNGRTYGNNPYVGYDTNPRPFLFNAEVDERLFAVERVLGYFTSDTAIAYPFSVLQETPVINDNVTGRDVVAFWQAGKASALDSRIIDDSRDVGMAALYERTLNEQTLTFMLNDEGAIVDEETGSRWNFFGEAIAGELEGEQLRQLQAFPHFWFAWAAFKPDTRIYGVEANTTQ
jgi:hypothetical protein